jgi:hypothetical protein
MLKLLDIIFLSLHLLVISFNMFGWIWIRTRKLHLIVLAATLFSWLILGLKYGLGYCFLTDWHWKTKMKLGETNLPNSFIKYFFDQYTFLDLSTKVVDTITIISFALAILIAIYLNFIKKKTALEKNL